MAGACCAGGAAAADGGAAGWLGLLLGLPALLIASFSRAPVLTALIGGPLLIALLAAYPLLVHLTPVRREALESELSYQFIDAKTEKEVSAKLPWLVQPSTNSEKDNANAGKVTPAEVDLSIVVPAYNETSRLGGMLDDALAYLEGSDDKANGKANGHAVKQGSKFDFPSRPRSYEILLVDDGSTDGTTAHALAYARSKRGVMQHGEMRVITLAKNRGKGGAVRHGVLHARGELVLFADADGATRFADVKQLIEEMRRICTPAGHGVVVGSRAHLVGTEAVVKRSFIRNLLMHCFHLFLTLLMRPPNPRSLVQKVPVLGPLLVPPPGRRRSTKKGSATSAQQPEIKDTQCGFKLFTRRTAAAIFPLAHIERWIFDVELLLLAEMASRVTARAKVVCDGTVLEVRRQSADQSNGVAATPAKEEEEEEEEGDPLLNLPVPIAEVAVHWEEVGGSKIDLLRDSVGMALDLLVIRANYALGRWKVPDAVAVLPVEQ